VTDVVDRELHILDQPARQRYEARLGDDVVGFSEYRRVERDRIILFHTEIDPAFEGKGFGSRLAAGVLDDIRARGFRLTVKCPFMAAYLKRHREYDDLLTGPTEPPRHARR
jgi:predicted GNAT family acetyltransferase